MVWVQQPIVAVQDANYNTEGKNSDPISLTITTNSSAGALSCATNPLPASSGVASFSGCKINNASTACYALKATDTTLGFTATSSCFYISNPADASRSTVSASPTTVVDNGTATSTITVTLKDVNGNAVSGKTVTLTANGGSSTISGGGSGVSNSSGVVTFTVTDTVPEAVIYTAADATDGVTINNTATVTFAPGQVSASDSTVTRTPATVSADGVSYSTITVTLADSSGDAIGGETVTLSQGSGHSVITLPSATTNASGVATFTVTDTTVENVTYTAGYSGTYGTGSLTTHTVSVNFTGIGTTLTLTVNPNNTTYGTSPIILTSGLSVTSGGAALSGVAVSFYESTGTCSASSNLVATVNTDSTGTATYPWTTTTLAAGTYHICAVSAQTIISNVTYLSASSGSQTLTVANTATTLSWTTAPPASATYNTSFTVAASTNSCATVTYAVTGGCSVNGSRVTMTSGTTACQVSANVAARSCSGTQFAAATLGPVTVTASPANQNTLTLRVSAGPYGDGGTFTLSTSGGSGTGAVTYSTSTPTVCSVTGNTMTMIASAGTCTLTATKASDGNYNSATSAPVSVNATTGTAVVTIGNTVQTYGSTGPVTVTTVPANLAYTVSYTGTNGTTYGPSATPPTAVGTYSVVVTITDSVDFPVVTGNRATETISQAAAGLVLTIPSGDSQPSPYGTMAYFDLTLGSCTPGSGPTGTVTLIVDGNPVAGLGGTATLDGSCSAVVLSTATIEPSPEAHDVYVQYSGDSNHPVGVSNTVLFIVSADATSVTLAATASSIDAGGSVTFTATVVPGGVDQANGPQGTVQFYVNGALVDTQALTSTSPYTAATTYTFAAAGSYNIVATYVPGTDQEFAGSSSAVTVTTVDLIAPTITWAANPQQPIVYGTPLSAVQLTATAADPVTGNTVTGTFAYTPAAGYVLHAGTPNLQANFTPDASESTIYSSNSATESITVTQAALTVTADNQTMVYGAAVPTLTYTFSGLVAGDVPIR